MPVKYFIRPGFNKLLIPIITFVILSVLGYSIDSDSFSIDNSVYASGISTQNMAASNLDGQLDFIIASPPDSNDENSNSGFVNLFTDSIKTDSLNADSLVTPVDTLAIDSTARLKHFKFNRESKPYTEFNPKRTSAFFAKPSQASYSRTVELDSSKSFVIIKEKYGNQDARIFLKIPVEEFIKMKLEAINKNNWEEIVYNYELQDLNKDLGQLLSDITNISIPLPSASFFSIFGPPVIKLKIQGAVDIHGAWRSETTEGITSSRLGNTRNEPDFKQQVQISVNGTIGDKLTINADWNTERTFEYENQLKLHYKGYEDEIIQSIEAGNVSLQTSPLVGGSEALFGVKAHFQMGPLTLTALASQKKGEVKEVSVSGGSTTSQFEKHAYDYSPNHYFIDSVYADPNLNVFNKYYGNASPVIIDELRIKELEVWKTAQGYKDPQRERTVNAFIDLEQKEAGPYPTDHPLRNTGLIENKARSIIGGRFIKLEEDVDYIYNQYTGVISFTSSIQNDDQVAVAYRQEGAPGNDNDLYYGEFIKDTDTSQVILLKLVKPQNLQPSFKTAWSLQLKNIYPIGGRDVKKEGFKFDIKYNVAGAEPVNELDGKKLLKEFGLDETDDAGGGNSDGAFDFLPNRTILPKTGEIIFPTLQPFGNDFPESIDQDLKYQAVYDTTVTFARQETALDKFVLVGEYSASVTSTYNIGFNVVENSVKVLLNGNELREGSDYSVDYNIGQVTIRNDAALVPGADLRITYEQNDLFALASKTLIGLRGIYEISRDTKLGFSFLNLNQQTLSDKVRIGEEPLNNSIYGIDFQTKHELPFLTKGLNNIISTSAPSSFSFRGEFAYMNPDPNTKKSTVASDNSESIAYIDDFEGAKRTIPVGMSDRSWSDISVPAELDIIGNPETDNELLMDNKGKSFWYNITPSNVFVEQIYGDRKQVAREDEQITVLDYVFRPDEPGTYNNTPDLTDPSISWGGIMKGLSSTASNLVEENIQFIEFWLNVSDYGTIPEGAKIYIDLGQISEDVIPNNELDTEDLDPQNDIEEPEEDTGIDGLRDSEEEGYDPVTNPDPSHDNFAFTLTNNDDPENYVRINGSQGNREFRNAGIKLPDTEDLNRNFSLDKVNSFYRYEVSLDTSKSNEFITGGGDGLKWFLYRIPLKDYKAEIGSPTFTVVENMRLWVGDVNQEIHLRFAEINLVGNQWQKVLDTAVTVDDEVLTIGTINVEDNPAYFSPPGVFRERDRSKPDQEVFKNEQSLELILNELKDGDSREAVKYLYRPLDVFNYKQMKFFIHGDEFDGPTNSVSYYADENNYGSEVYFRFGTDTANFYEYRQPVRAGWNEVKILFEQLTAKKQGRTFDEERQLLTFPVANEPGHTFGVKGNPTLTSVKFFLVGILNPNQQDGSDIGEAVSGNVWINELRVLEAEDTPGWAYSANTSISFADLLTVNANMSKTDPYFHKLADRFGSRVDRSNWGVSLDLDVLKLAPVNMEGSNLRVNYSRNESVSRPLYSPGTDIFVDSAVAQTERQLIADGVAPEEAKRQAKIIETNSQTLSVKETWSLSNIKLKVPSNKWYFRDTFNSLTFGFNYNRSISRDPTTSKRSNWVWNASAKYSLNFSKDYWLYPANIPVLGWLFSIFNDYRNVKFYFTPQNFAFSLSAKRNRSFALNRTVGSAPNIQRDFSANRSFKFNWKFTEGGFLNPSINYSLDIASTLAHLLVDGERERNSSAIFGDIFGGQFFGKDNNYRQSVDLKLNPKLPSLWDISRYFTLTASYNVNYNWRFNIQQDTLGRSANFSNSIRAGLTLRWKSLTAPLFKESVSKSKSKSKKRNPNPRPTNRKSRSNRKDRNLDDEIGNVNRKDSNDSLRITTAEVAEPDTTVDTGPSSIMKLLNFMKLGAKWLFFDYDQFAINFSQQNTVGNTGLKHEGTGLNNFWGIKQSKRNGPGRLYQLGLSHDPGARAANGNLADNFSQKNSFDFKTSRPLWEGAQIDFNWKLSWGINKTTTISTDEFGAVTITNVSASRNINRSFVSFPSTLFLSAFGSGIKKVNELYNPDADDPNKSLSDAFLEGFESAPIVSKLPFLQDLTKYIPRPNWRFSWTGLEKIGLFKSFTQRVSLNHSYTSNYNEGLKISPDGREEIQKQTISYGFAPLVGINLTFKDMWGGKLSGNIKYSTKTSYDLGVSTRNISESFQKDMSFSASFSKSGFEIPLFGVSLKNDVEISLSYTTGRNSVVLFEMDNFNEEGKPQDGTTRTTIEPRIKYVISSKVTLSLFYKSTTVVPEGAARIPETSTNEAGLDVHIAIGN